MSNHEHLAQYQGQIVPQSYHVGFVVLSCLVSFVGAASTLELINRRTGFRGWFNNLLLVSSAVTMGGVAIWSMHFVANRAMELASGEPEMQVSYSPGFTVLSFFVPILVLLAAFTAVGSNDHISWWRIAVGGTICGGAVCGMHYLGNASIANYHCVYNGVNVAGAAIIAVAASTIALTMFFVFRSMWANAWWKRIISAVILASAVSGMHWCAALGTEYRLISPNKGGTDRDAIVIVVICLGLAACLIVAGLVALKARSMRKSARTAQQINLAAAVFDKQGRVLVDTNGLMPSVVVTDSFLEKDGKSGFSVSHPLFLWMFQASRNWASISSLIGGMKSHLSQLPHSGRGKNGSLGIDLINNLGELVDDYNVIFRELFCVAALTLAERLGEPLPSTRVLWDEILATGAKNEHEHPATNKRARTPPDSPVNTTDLAEKGGIERPQEHGRGLLMFLVRRVESDGEVDRLASAGYRFAEVRQVSGLIRSGMQIQSPDVESKLRSMATCADQHLESPLAAVSLGFFAIKASIDRSGFYLLAQKGAMGSLPSTSLPVAKLEAWHQDLLKRFDGMSVSYILHAIATPAAAEEMMGPREKAFASQLASTIQRLRSTIQDPLFDDAVLTSTPLTVPYLDHAGVETTRKLLAFRLLIPLHSAIRSPVCALTPLSLFKVRQLSQQQRLEFVQGVHRDLGPFVKNLPDDAATRRGKTEQRGWSKRLRGTLPEPAMWARGAPVDMDVDDKLISTISHRRLSSCRSDSTADLCPPGSGRSMSLGADDDDKAAADPAAVQRPPTAAAPQPYSGILVSQEVTVHDEAEDTMDYEMYRRSDRSRTTNIWNPAKSSRRLRGTELKPIRPGQTRVMGGWRAALGHSPTFVDVLFAQCVNSHSWDTEEGVFG
ncbi:Signaling protein-like protein [Emericellopsis cladophorae]|uniref:Signaling protein-like protein n=1 Tax=Emericellopsis cladophorae TaxID=2686198 RepID=A0A9Q0BGI6_9HYPO|nr:Signaling protein-like protein [Emericellopsis cladophorae]KAI6783394.1 Signaling protein-like protein [Emericellopsis cladophorae]